MVLLHALAHVRNAFPASCCRVHCNCAWQDARKYCATSLTLHFTLLRARLFRCTHLRVFHLRWHSTGHFVGLTNVLVALWMAFETHQLWQLQASGVLDAHPLFKHAATLNENGNL